MVDATSNQRFISFAWMGKCGRQSSMVWLYTSAIWTSCEKNQKQQLALEEANQKTTWRRQPKLNLIAALVAMALVMGGRHVDSVSADGSRSEPLGLVQQVRLSKSSRPPSEPGT